MIQIEESNPSFESCSDCVHYDDYEEICIFRRCIHAVAQLNECYVPKHSTIEPEMVRCKDCNHWSRESICDGFCSEDCMRHDEDFYCGYAERKTE